MTHKKYTDLAAQHRQYKMLTRAYATAAATAVGLAVVIGVPLIKRAAHDSRRDAGILCNPATDQSTVNHIAEFRAGSWFGTAGELVSDRCADRFFVAPDGKVKIIPSHQLDL
jgi:streptogramin lyase